LQREPTETIRILSDLSSSRQRQAACGVDRREGDALDQMAPPWNKRPWSPAIPSSVAAPPSRSDQVSLQRLAWTNVHYLAIRTRKRPFRFPHHKQPLSGGSPLPTTGHSVHMRLMAASRLPTVRLC